jgi:hypothetical protein
MDTLIKQYKKAQQEVKANIQQMITNNNNFCCTTADIFYQIDIKNEEDGTSEKLTVYPTSDECNKWMEELFEVELKYKELNAQAVESMKKKGIHPKKQCREIMLLVVVPSKTTVNIGISLPENNNMNIDIKMFINSALSNYDVTIDVKNGVYYCSCIHESPMKYRDEVMLMLFNQLKLDKIYIEEIEDEMPLDFEM